ncbi:fibrinogen-like protein 1 [Anopheles ziemanni]|uniref:fibrinogen-like protein 1 n=1 Tax=Anopheles coustani TaxID=139045 RepID=UPI0026582CC7|nr:fibrinogen-like protein 1 [Anopheles coustani]XP_058177300.1 fibrinogen-like protein 1 [Anopheles ziemanni]
MLWRTWPTTAGTLSTESRRTNGPYTSCREEPSKVSGIYLIQLDPDGGGQPFEVYCEQTSFDGGWIVIQRRAHGKENFYRGWTDYRNGFGNLSDEFWLGLEHLNDITFRRPHELMVEVEDFEGNQGYANYKKFEVGDEDDGYHLEKMGDYSGTAGDSMWPNWGEKFSTYDRDNDDWSEGNCATDRQGAWWFYKCTNANLNGRYLNTTNDKTSMTWDFLKYDWRGMSYSRMMIRELITNPER